MKRSSRATRASFATVLAALLVPWLAPISRAAEPGRVVPVPTVEAVPADAGIHGGPQVAQAENPSAFGYLEQEFFFSGHSQELRHDDGAPGLQDAHARDAAR